LNNTSYNNLSLPEYIDGADIDVINTNTSAIDYLLSKKLDNPASPMPGKYLQINENGQPIWGEAVPTQTITDAISAWMSARVEQNQAIGLALDNTLTGSGRAADAKAVGDAIEQVRRSPFVGSQGVAFGTSLTARSKNNVGYLTYLPNLMGVGFENKGVGSACITGNGDITRNINNYTDYSSKKICLVEGFVNDWSQNKTLGTWKSTDTSTACGALRSAINYIYSKNRFITLFIIFDHYGRNYQGDNRSSTGTNASGLTQYEYYEEMSKVAESLGVPVIKAYSESQMSENTPAYYNDYIHLTDLGSRQCAYFIWNKLKQYYPNQL